MMLCENIRETRRAKGMTQEALAEAMGVSAASVSKWETGQSAPELTVLTALADFFEVSVDALLGHEVRADRQQAMLAEMDALAGEWKFEEAKVLARQLLKNYPNSYQVLDRVATLYYRIQVTTGDESAMRTSISLVKRMFPLAEGGERERLELLGRLANQYDLLGEKETAKQYYEQANVSNCWERMLAYLQARTGTQEERPKGVSAVLQKSLLNLIGDAMILREVWEEAGEREKAREALYWAADVLELAGAELQKNTVPVGVALYLNIAALDSEAGDTSGAEEAIRKAVRFIRGGSGAKSLGFLALEEPDVIATQTLYDGQGLISLLRQMELEALIPVVEEAMG